MCVKFPLRDETHFIFVRGLKVELTGGVDAVLVGHDLLMGDLQGVMGEQEVRAGEKMKILQGQAGVGSDKARPLIYQVWGGFRRAPLF